MVWFNKSSKVNRFNFLYDDKKSGLYLNNNAADKGFGEVGIIAFSKVLLI